jgi:glutaredoxin
MKKITIYTNENCPYCKQIKEFLSEKDIEATYKITKDHENEWKKITNLTNMPVTPTVYYEDNYFLPGRDFYSPDHLLELLKSFSKSTFSINRRLYETIRTTNYNMNMAFSRIDQLLKQIEANTKKEEKDEHKSTN